MEIDVVGAGRGLRSSPSPSPEVTLNGGQDTVSGPEMANKTDAEHQTSLSKDEDDDFCRICRNPGDDESPLYYPCACRGSIKYVHEDCLLRWLSHSHARQCELCKHAFAFSPVYAENAPSTLPFHEFLLDVTLKAGRGMSFVMRLTFVLSVWILFIPLTTFWIWRFTFVRSFSEAHTVFISRCTFGLLVKDCLDGLLLSVGISLIFLGCTAWREYFGDLVELGDEDEEGVDRGRAGRQVGPDGAEGVPFDELVGMQGSVFRLIENAITVLAHNATLLALVALLPFTLGRLVLSVASRLVFVNISASGSLPLNTTFSTMEKIPLGNMSAVLARRNVFFEETTNIAGSNGSNFGGIASGYDGNVVRIDVTQAMAAALQLSDAASVALGYGVILMALSIYFGLLALIRYSRGETITVGHIHRLARMAEAVPSVARHVMAGVKHMATMVKVQFILIIKLGAFPLMCGWWLDICTLGILDVSITQRVEFFRASPLRSSSLHWLVGIVYMVQINIFCRLLREVLRPSVLYFLRDPNDPNYRPLREVIDTHIYKLARRELFTGLLYGCLTLMLVYLPVRLAILSAPSMFPLQIRVSDRFVETSTDIVFFGMCISFVMEHFRPRAIIRAGLFYWFSTVGGALGIREFLLPNPEETNVNNNERERGYRVLEGQADIPDRNQAQAALHELRGGEAPEVNIIREESAEYDGGEIRQENKLVLRVVMLLLGGWITLVAVNSATILVPITLGRGMLSLSSQLSIARGAKCDDLHAFNIGCYMLWATAPALRHAIDFFKRTDDFHGLLMQVLKCSAVVAKSAILLSLWYVVIPFLIGLLFELLVVVPLSGGLLHESSASMFYQDWVLGLVLLKCWTRLVMRGQIMPLVDESWRLRFEQVRADGFANLRAFWVLKEIIAPTFVRLLMALCAPDVFARWIFPSLGYSLIVNSAVYRFSWLGFLAIALLCYVEKLLRRWLVDLHNSIRDDRYLVERRLHNFKERLG